MSRHLQNGLSVFEEVLFNLSVYSFERNSREKDYTKLWVYLRRNITDYYRVVKIDEGNIELSSSNIKDKLNNFNVQVDDDKKI